MTKQTRIVLFLITALLLLIIFLVTRGELQHSSTPSILIFSSLLMLSFVTLFLEHFFTTPTDVLSSTLAILLLLSPLRNQLQAFGIWYLIFFTYNLVLALAALSALLLLDDTHSKGSTRNVISRRLKWFASHFGNGRFLFATLFFLSLMFYVDSQSRAFVILASYAAVLLLVDPKTYFVKSFAREGGAGRDVGEIIGVQAKNTFLAKLFTSRLPVRRFDLVEFKYSMDESHSTQGGLIIDNYLLNEQQWVKILSTKELIESIETGDSSQDLKTNIVYKLEEGQSPALLNRFVGIIVEQSSIGRIRFQYAGKNPVYEGTLLEAQVDRNTVLYQVIQGITDVESLDSKNETGFVVGEAVQVGTWNPDRFSFDKFGWVPDINTPVLLAQDVETPTVGDDKFVIGRIPATNYPVLMDLDDAISHHLAILGVTGCGKSFLARHLIRTIATRGTKIICVDFTNEYGTRLQDLAPTPIINPDHQDELFQSIDALTLEQSKFVNQQNQTLISQHEGILTARFRGQITEFLQSDRSVALFELPDVSNTSGILEYTKWFFRQLFHIARTAGNFGQQVCVVLEEAHTVIPEWNFVGIEEKRAQALVNSIGQIALQGRKYGIGFVVIAQRTANVSKTVLTQCNTVVAFQQFDKTGSDYLAHYVGTNMATALPTLKFRQAIAAGKGFASGAPIIFEVPVLQEEEG